MSTFVRILGPILRSGVQDLALRRLARRDPEKLGEIGEHEPWLAGEMKRLHPVDVVDAGKAIAAFDAREWLDEIDVPCASVITTRDWAVRPAKQYATAAALGASIVELDAGHVVCITDPKAFGEAVRDAIDDVSAALRPSLFARLSEWWQRVERVEPTQELSASSSAAVTTPLPVPNATRQLPSHLRVTEPVVTEKVSTEPVATQELVSTERS